METLFYLSQKHQGHYFFLEEFNLPHPCCLHYDILLPSEALNERHINNAQCAKGEERKRCWLVAEYMREITSRALQAYGRPLESVTSFKYLGRIMTSPFGDWPEVVGNLHKSRNIGARLLRVLGL